jgi:uncharacterized membrane protein YccF (DUF307 family)
LRSRNAAGGLLHKLVKDGLVVRIRRGCYVKDFPRGTTATVRAFDTRDVETVLGDGLRPINQRRPRSRILRGPFAAQPHLPSHTLLPFGYKAVSRAAYSGQEDIGTGPLGVLGNLVWLLLAGWWLALGHLITAVLLACTIIGIPFAWAHVKLAGLAIWPIGKMIVPAQDAPLRYARRW